MSKYIRFDDSQVKEISEDMTDLFKELLLTIDKNKNDDKILTLIEDYVNTGFEIVDRYFYG